MCSSLIYAGNWLSLLLSVYRPHSLLTAMLRRNGHGGRCGRHGQAVHPRYHWQRRRHSVSLHPVCHQLTRGSASLAASAVQSPGGSRRRAAGMRSNRTAWDERTRAESVRCVQATPVYIFCSCTVTSCVLYSQRHATRAAPVSSQTVNGVAVSGALVHRLLARQTKRERHVGRKIRRREGESGLRREGLRREGWSSVFAVGAAG